MNNLALKQTLSTQQLTLLQTEMDKKKRSVGVSYLFLFLFSALGVHQFYLKNKPRAFLFLFTQGSAVAMVLSGWMLFFGSLATTAHAKSTALNMASSAGGMWAFAILFAVVGGLMWLWDLFTLGGQVDRANERIESQIISSINISNLDSEPIPKAL